MPENIPASGSLSDVPIPRVSVILITYNQAAALRRAVAALEQSQDRGDFEIVVADCASTDGTTKLDTEFPSLNIMRLPHHMGAVRAMNIATRTAKADLLFYLSPDVEVAPDTIKRLADALESSDEATIAACPVFRDPAGQVIPKAFRLPTREVLEKAIDGASLTPIAVDTASDATTVEVASLDAFLVRKAFIRSMNYFDQRYGHYFADIELGMQARQASKKMRVHPAIEVTYHPAPDPLAGDSIIGIDRANGAAEFVGKYEGGSAAFKFRLGLALGALAKFDFGRFGAILGGTKLDGGQR